MPEFSLRTRVAAVVAVAAIVCAVLMAVMGLRITRVRIEETAGGASMDVAMLLAEDLQEIGLTPQRLAADPELRERASQDLARHLERLNKAGSIWTNASILQPDGDRWLVLARADESGSDRRIRGVGETLRVIDQPGFRMPSLREPVSGRFRTDLNEWFGTTVPFGASNAGAPAPGVLSMTMHLDDAQAYLAEIARTVLAALGISIVVGLALGWWCAGLILRPIDAVREFAARLGRREYARRVPVRGAPEMRALLRDMNGLAEALVERDIRLHERMVRMAEMRDPKETGPHVKRVSGVSLEIFEGWLTRHPMESHEADFARSTLRMAATLHDIGKVGIDDAVLRKPGKLDEAEYLQIKHHGILATAVLEDTDPYDRAARDVALGHHERWDGKGYPGPIELGSGHADSSSLRELPISPIGRSGTDIPLFARIVAIADVFDALSSRRAYKEAWSEQRVLQAIRDDAGKAFDPELVEIFVERFAAVKAAWSRHPDQHAAVS